MVPFYVRAGAACLLLGLASTVVRCAIWSAHPAACTHNVMHGWLLALLNITYILVGVWVGLEAATRWRRQWVGWVAGLVTVVALLAVLTWAGLDLRSDADESVDADQADNNYRR